MMKMQTSGSQDDKFVQRRSPLPTILSVLIALVIGGCLTLLIVSRLLQTQLEAYSSPESMDAASAILDFMDDLLPLYLLCGSVLFLLLIISATIWAWTRTQSRLLRYGFIIMLVLGLALIAGLWLLGSTSGPITFPQPPAPN